MSGHNPSFASDPDANKAFTIRSIAPGDRAAVTDLLNRRWGASMIVSRGRPHDAAALPGCVAIGAAGGVIGLITWHLSDAECEIVTLDALKPGRGIGTALVDAAYRAARDHGCRRIFLVTSNDNVGAVTFYQKIDFRICAVHVGSVDRARRIKPQIPLVGANGIPIHDEIELERQV